MFDIHRRYVVILGICCALGCTEKPAPDPADAPKQQAAPVPEAAQAPEAEQPPTAVQPACLGGTEDGDSCTCGPVRIARAEAADWACGEGFWRCVNNDGCKYQGISYPAGTDITQNGAQCGFYGDIPNREQYKCMLEDGAWQCMHHECTCHGKAVAHDDKCFSKSCQGVELENRKGLNCTANGWEVEETGSYALDGSVYKLPEGIFIRKDVLACGGHEIPWRDADKYECTALGWKLGSHWTCQNKKGCACGDSKCKKGEQCDDGKCHALVKKCEKGNCPCGDGFCMKDGVCVEGHCICGEPSEYMMNPEQTSNGEPPINDKQAYWALDGENVGRDTHIFTSNRFGEFTCDSETVEGTCYSIEYFARCEKEGGCWTTDGRHYEQDAIAPGTWDHDEAYHIDAGFDLTLSSPESGTCVFERNDDLKRLKEAGKKATTFICDEKTCRCGKHKCHLGQVCREGTCENDTCQIDEALKTDKYIKDDPYCDGDIPDINAANAGNPGESASDSSDPDICTGKWVHTYDPDTCKGGTRWCRGTADKAARPAPQMPDGYRCLPLSSFDDKTASRSFDDTHKVWTCKTSNCKCGGEFCPENAACIDEKCIYAGKPVPDEFKKQNCSADRNTFSCNMKVDTDDTVCYGEPKPGEGYACDRIRMNGWKCTAAEGCSCGGTFAPQNTTCKHNKVFCGNIARGDGDPSKYSCQNINDYVDIQVWVCTDPNGCACGKQTCRDAELCQSGTCTCNGLIRPGSDFKCSRMYDRTRWTCNDENGCTCPFDGNDIDSGDPCTTDALKYAGIKNGAYTCGGKPLDIDSGYICNENQEIVCNQTACACGSNVETDLKCPKFAICTDGKCLHPQTHQPIKADDEGYFTEGVMHLCLSPKWCKCEAEPSGCTAGKFCTHDGCEDLRLNFDQGHYFAGHYEVMEDETDEIRGSELPLPKWDEMYRTYYFHVEEVLKGMCSSSTIDADYSAICGDPKGCACGDARCPMGATCLDGQCQLSDEETTCKSTHLDAQHGDFKCGTLGWTCTGENCPCGDATCKPLEICLKSGLCVPVKN